MNDYGTLIDKNTVKYERLLPGPIELVWKCLTESDHKAKWLSAGNVEPKVGGKVTHLFDHKKMTPDDDPIPEKYADLYETSSSYGIVTQYQPYTLLAYTWEEGDGMNSEVTFELSPAEENKVKLVLIHRQLPDEKDIKVGIGAGWHTHLNILRDVLEGNKPKGFWSVHMPLEKEYEKIV